MLRYIYTEHSKGVNDVTCFFSDLLMTHFSTILLVAQFYTCQDGTQIDQGKVCDGYIDCSGEDDEMDCQGSVSLKIFFHLPTLDSKPISAIDLVTVLSSVSIVMTLFKF